MARRARARIEQLAPDPAPRPQLGELGVQGINPFGYYASEEAYDYANVTISDLERMVQQDGQAASLYRVLTMPIQASEAHLSQPTGGEAEFKFINTQLFGSPQEGGMLTPWKGVISNLSKAVLSGSEVLEICYRAGKLAGSDYILLDKLAPRQRKTLSFLTDRKGEFSGVKQSVPDKGPIEIPKNKCFHYVVGEEMNPVFGQSMLLPAYYHYKQKHKLYYIGHLGFAIAAIALKKLRVPADANPIDKQTFERAAASMGTNTTITIPEGYEMELEYGSKVPAEMIPFVNHHDAQMTKAVLAQILNLGSEGTSGSYALSETQMSMLFIVEEALMDDLSYLFNTTIIPNLVDWNFGTSKYPKLEIAPSYTDRREAVKEIFRHLAGVRQVNTSADFMVTLEEAMAQQLGFQEIDYTKEHDSMVADFKKRQDALTAKAAGPAVAGKKPVPGRPGAGAATRPAPKK